MTLKHTFVFSAFPENKSSFKDFFHNGPVRELLENPGGLRYAGWDLQTLDTARIIKGTHYELRNGDRKVLHLYEDGTFIVRALADPSFLCWGGEEKNTRLNSLALIEFTYNFVWLYSRLLGHLDPLPKNIGFLIDISNAILHDSTLYFVPYPVNSFGWMAGNEKFPAPEGSKKIEITSTADLVRQEPERVAYWIIEKIYLWFGISPENIPYTRAKENGVVIDVDQIKNQRVL